MHHHGPTDNFYWPVRDIAYVPVKTPNSISSSSRQYCILQKELQQMIDDNDACNASNQRLFWCFEGYFGVLKVILVFWRLFWCFEGYFGVLKVILVFWRLFCCFEGYFVVLKVILLFWRLFCVCSIEIHQLSMHVISILFAHSEDWKYS